MSDATPLAAADAPIKITEPAPRWTAALWSIGKLPAQIVLVGLAALLIMWVSSLFHIKAFDALSFSLQGVNVLHAFVALLFFAVGLSFTAFLWWVVDRYFELISSGKMKPESLADLKDLPMGLPEGTVRAVLALIVAVIGLPLMLFSQVLTLTPEISGYINGIIAGVFGYYFGSRNTGVPTKAVTQIAAANARADAAEDDRDDAQQDSIAATAMVQKSQDVAAAATRAAGFSPAVSKLTRDLSIGSTILDVIAPALPAGILPSGLTTAVATARSALNAVQGVTQNSVTDGQQQVLQDAVGAVLGHGGTAAVGALLMKAAPMLAGFGITGLTPVSALVALLSVGAKLGSTEYARWRARVLAAPLAHGLIEFGTVTPDDVHAALLDAPIFAKAFSEERDRDGFDANMADAVLRDDALDRLWRLYGSAEKGQPPLFTTRAQLEAGLSEFTQQILANRTAHDVPGTLTSSLADALGKASNPAYRPADVKVLTPETVNQLVGVAYKASASGSAVPTEAHAAFDALITLVGHARESGVDLVQTLAEVPA